MKSFWIHEFLSCAGIFWFADDLICFLHDLIETLVVGRIGSAGFGLHRKDALLYPLANLMVWLWCNHLYPTKNRKMKLQYFVVVFFFWFCFLFWFKLRERIKRKGRKGYFWNDIESVIYFYLIRLNMNSN